MPESKYALISYAKRHGPKCVSHRREAILIYALVDPGDESVRYVGVTRSREQRLRNHREAKSSNWQLRAWVKSVERAGRLVEMRTLGTTRANRWEDDERRWIAWFKKVGFSLLNVHPGGRCFVNQKVIGVPAGGEPIQTKPGKRKGRINQLGIYQRARTPKQRFLAVPRAISEFIEPAKKSQFKAPETFHPSERIFWESMKRGRPIAPEPECTLRAISVEVKAMRKAQHRVVRSR